MSSFKKRSNEWWEAIIQEALTKGLPEISERENLSVSAICYQLKKRGIDRPIQRNRMHNLNENFFEVIDTEEKAYWLGFIMADGCVTRTTNTTNNKPNRLSFNLSSVDHNHLEKFTRALNSSAKVTEVIPKGSYSNNPISRLSINSVKLCSDLAKYGILERKTGSECVPDFEPCTLRHFIRGFFDGDGYVTYNRNRKHEIVSPVVGFTSNEQFLVQIKDIFKTNCCITGNPSVIRETRNNAKAWYIAYGGKQDVKNIHKFLYKGATIFLDRKYTKFNQLLSIVA